MGKLNLSYDEFLEFGKECTLNLLKKLDSSNNKLNEAKREHIHDTIMLKDIEEDIKKLSIYINEYVKLYQAFSYELTNKNEDGKNDVLKAEEIVEKIMDANGLTFEYIIEEIKKRKEFKGQSGAEVVKNFLDYQLKELEETKNSIERKILKILADETKLKFEMEISVTEEEGREVIEKLMKNQKENEFYSQKLKICQEKIDEIKEDIESKWKYEIYGTISKDELRNKI